MTDFFSKSDDADSIMTSMAMVGDIDNREAFGKFSEEEYQYLKSKAEEKGNSKKN